MAQVKLIALFIVGEKELIMDFSLSQTFSFGG